MQPSISSAVAHAFPPQVGANLGAGVDLDAAVHDPRFPHLVAFHEGLRDAMLMEIPRELQPWIAAIGGRAIQGRLPSASAELAHAEPFAGRLTQLHAELFTHAFGADPANAGDGPEQLKAALSELLLFEAVRLQLLVMVWSSTEFESLGGDEQAIDTIAWSEVEALLLEPGMFSDDVRPLPIMVAAGSVALARDAADRAEALRMVNEDQRETLRMRARLRAALRELRLTESVLLENALAGLLGEERVELPDLQASHPLALDGLSRQAMDQRVSRGRRALSQDRDKWPNRRRPALFDLLRDANSEH